MGSPPIPDRSPPPAQSSSRPPAFRNRSPPAPHPGLRPAVAPASVPFSPPKRTTGGSIKGKERALNWGADGGREEDDGREGQDPDFPPQGTPTYRHLLGNNNVGPTNPLRVIAHIDIDAAYAAMEMSRLGIPEDQPMAVQQWNGLIAVNYPARRFGITRHESPAEALKKCPELRLVHVQTYKNGESEPGYWEGAKPETHKVSLDMYRKESRKIVAVFSEFCPIVEKASIDESFLDLTAPVRKLLLAQYPSLSALPPGATLDTPLPPPFSLGLTKDSIDWAGLCNLIPFEGQEKEKLRRLLADGTEAPPSSSPVKTSTTPGDAPPVPSTSRSPSPQDYLEPPLSWSDIALSLGASIVAETRAAVKERLGYTCSAGVAPNKMLAKLTSAWKKPDAQTVLRHSCIPAFFRPMGFQKIRNLGGKLGNAVKETYEAETVGDLLKLPLSELKAKLGEESGQWLWEIVRGLDYTEVETKTQVKSMLSSKNFRPYITTYGEVLHWLTILATELALRLNDAREITPGLWPKTITFTHRSPTFVIRSHQAPFPFTSQPTSSYILKHAEKLFRTALGPPTPMNGPVPGETKIGPYGNIQLSFSGLERGEEGQRGIEGFFSAAAGGAVGAVGGGGAKRGGTPVLANGRKEEKPKKNEKKSKAAPRLAVKKESSSSSGPLLNSDGSPLELVLSSDSDSSSSPPPLPAKRRRSPSASSASTSKSKKPRPGAEETLSATCPKCKAVLIADEDGKEALRKVEEEHQDWHLAREILEKERKKSGWGLSSSSSTSNGKNGASSSSFSKKRSNGGGEDGDEGSGGKIKKKKKPKEDEGKLTGFFRPK
ncbi:hypothetical protein JCM8547_007530 [Rhodosporidiobolus lusitaniae]